MPARKTYRPLDNKKSGRNFPVAFSIGAPDSLYGVEYSLVKRNNALVILFQTLRQTGLPFIGKPFGFQKFRTRRPPAYSLIG